MSICLKEFGVVCSLGNSKQQVFDNLVSGSNDFLQYDAKLPLEEAQWVGRAFIPNNENINKINTRNNQLAYLAYKQIEDVLTPLVKQYGRKRIAVIIGTSTAGTYEGEMARSDLAETGSFPDSFHYEMQEMGAPARFIANLCGAQGPVYSISTACSSSGKVFASARSLIEADLADVVIAGGVDSLTRLTVNGFKSLESIADTQCQPFGEHRDGINIGEAAALFIVNKEDSGIQLLGVGETSDAYHMSAPSPDGDGAFKAMNMALEDANIAGENIDYVNLHGTGTNKNDAMEALAMMKACGAGVLCSSTKHLTGHTLGAAGALEVGLCWLLLSDLNTLGYTPNNRVDIEVDPLLPAINFCKNNVSELKLCMSNSFAFGGNNFSAVLGRVSE